MSIRSSTVAEENKYGKIVLFLSNDLFRQLLFAQFVQGEEFPGQSNIVNKTTTSELHADDNLSVRHHHGHCTELDL